MPFTREIDSSLRMLRVKAYSASGSHLDTIAFGLDALHSGLLDCLLAAAEFFSKHAANCDGLADIFGLPEAEQHDLFLRFVETYITPDAGFPADKIRDLIDEVKGRVVLNALREM